MNKLQIARNLEYVAGGINAIKRICAEEKDKYFALMLDEWEKWIFDALDLVLEDDEDATDT